MNLNEARKILLNYGYLLEDTDELDDADLGINVNPKEYHKQKSKQQSLEEKIKNALNRQTIEYNSKLVKMIKKLNNQHKNFYPNDYEGDWYINYKSENPIKDLIYTFKCGYKDRKGKFPGQNIINEFKNVWLKEAKKLLNGRTVKIYRALSFTKDFIDKNDIYTLIRTNLMDRNSWTFNKDVAFDYMEKYENVAKTMVISMNCSLDDVQLYYSAWLEGFWGGRGAPSAKIGNEEFNLKYSLKINNVNIEIEKDE